MCRTTSTNYSTQLGFGKNGAYLRTFQNKALDTTTPWQKFIVDDGNGNVSITGTLTTDLINCNSDISAYGFYEKSDERLKTFSDSVEVNLDKLSSLRKSHFTYNDDESKKRHIGVSAQEIKEIYPEIVSGDDKLTVDYTKLSVIALAAVDELHKKNVELEARLAKLEAMLLK